MAESKIIVFFLQHHIVIDSGGDIDSHMNGRLLDYIRHGRMTMHRLDVRARSSGFQCFEEIGSADGERCLSRQTFAAGAFAIVELSSKVQS